MIAITGANGLLGSFMVRKFISSGEQVIGIKRSHSDLQLLQDVASKIEWREADVTDSVSLLESLKGVDTVIHAAALVSFDPRLKEKMFSINVEGTRNVVNACLSLHIPRLIFISSVAALGRKKEAIEIDEENKWTENEVNSDYAQSKYLAELEIYRGQEEGLSVGIVCPSVILAPANPHKSSAQLFNYVLKERKFYSEANINYVDVRDVVDIVFTIFKNRSTEKFIASAESIEMKLLLADIAKRLNKKIPTLKIGGIILQLVAMLEELRGKLTGSELLISRQSVKMAEGKFLYQNKKSVTQLGIHYRSLDETLDWCCAHYRHLQ